MLRKEILRTDRVSNDRGAEIDIAARATVLVTSEDPDHPIDHAFDGQRGPGASRWISGASGPQTVVVAFDAPQTIRALLVEIDEPDTARTQEMEVSISTDGGATYRHPPGVQLQPAWDVVRARTVVGRRRWRDARPVDDQARQGRSGLPGDADLARSGITCRAAPRPGRRAPMIEHHARRLSHARFRREGGVYDGVR